MSAQIVPFRPGATAPLRPQRIEGLPPPRDEDAERATLSTMLIVPGTAERLQDIVAPHEFSLPPHRLVAEAIFDLTSSGQPIDAQTLLSYMRERGTLSKLPDGAVFIANLADASPAPENVAAHATTIRKAAIAREIIATCQTIAAEGYGSYGEYAADILQQRVEPGKELEAWRDAIQRRLDAVLAKATLGGAERHAIVAERAAHKAYERAQARAQGHMGAVYDLPIENLSMSGGEWYLIGGETSDGKTTFLLDTAARLAERRIACLIFSLEQHKDELGLKLDCRSAGMSVAPISHGRPDADWSAFWSGHAKNKPLPIWWEVRKPLTPARFKAWTKAVQAEARAAGFELGFVGLDYIQKVRVPQLGAAKDDRNEEAIIRHFADFIDAMRQEPWAANIAWAILSQLKKSDRGWKGCSALEDAAPNAWKLRRPLKGKKDHAHDRVQPLEIEITKARNGTRDVVLETRIDLVAGRVGDDV